MNIKEKIENLKDKNMGEWLRVRQQVEDELSKQQATFCVCGRLATGLHESGCRKFNQLVDKQTAKRININ